VHGLASRGPLASRTTAFPANDPVRVRIGGPTYVSVLCESDGATDANLELFVLA